MIPQKKPTSQVKHPHQLTPIRQTIRLAMERLVWAQRYLEEPCCQLETAMEHTDEAVAYAKEARTAIESVLRHEEA